MECVEIVLAHAGQRSVLSLREVLRCGRVSRRWREAVLAALPTLRALDFRGRETVAGAGDTAQKKLAENKK